MTGWSVIDAVGDEHLVEIIGGADGVVTVRYESGDEETFDADEINKRETLR